MVSAGVISLGGSPSQATELVVSGLIGRPIPHGNDIAAGGGGGSPDKIVQVASFGRSPPPFPITRYGIPGSPLSLYVLAHVPAYRLTVLPVSIVSAVLSKRSVSPATRVPTYSPFAPF